MRFQNRLTAILATLTMAIGAVGVPIPSGRKQSGERFPCEGSLCGCNDAAACWDHCCCHTNQERLRWAAENGVTPPAFVVAAAKREGETGHPHACCEASKANSCCESPAKHDCCETEPAKPLRVVSLVSALKCRGLTASIGYLPPSLPPDVMSF